MDGNKKIKQLLFAAILFLGLTGCKINMPGYVSMYVDNQMVNDTIGNLAVPLTATTAEQSDSIAFIQIMEHETEARKADSIQLAIDQKNLIFQLELKEMIRNISDSIYLLQYQLNEVQKQMVQTPPAAEKPSTMPDTLEMAAAMNTPEPVLMDSLAEPAEPLMPAISELVTTDTVFITNIVVDTVFVTKEIQMAMVKDSLPSSGDSVQLQALIEERDANMALMQFQIDSLSNLLNQKPDSAFLAKPKFADASVDTTHLFSEQANWMQLKNDTILSLRQQLMDLQMSMPAVPDTVFIAKTVEDPVQNDPALQQLIENKDRQLLKLQQQLDSLKALPVSSADTIVITREVPVSLPSDSNIQLKANDQLIRAQNDTILMLRQKLLAMDNAMRAKADTTQLPKASAVLNSEMHQQQKLLQEKDEQLQMLQQQLNAAKGPDVMPPADNQQNLDLTLQLLRARDEQISLLLYQLDRVQTASDTEGQQTAASRQSNDVIVQLLQAQKDSIQMLRQQLQSALPQASQQKATLTNDTLAAEEQPVEDPSSVVSEQFKALQDTVEVLKTSMQQLEEKLLPEESDSISVQADMKVADTVLMVSFYNRGQIKPIDEGLLVQQMKEVFLNNLVAKVTLSGFTDSSGDEVFNKLITNKRLNYLSDIVVQWIPKEKIFFQNFGDAFASDSVVSDERKVEITIHLE